MRVASLFLLRLRLLAMKFGWANCVVLALVLLALMAYLVGIPYAANRLRTEQRKLAQSMAARNAVVPPLASTSRTGNDERLARFYDVLGESKYAEEQLAGLFAIAEKTNLVLQQADYRLNRDGPGRFTTYHVQLPLKGPYGAIQQFCEQALLLIPFASLDQISFKRDGIGSDVIDAQLSFTLYLSAPGGAASVQAREGAAE
ncbi:MAG TPA: hypothetical protein VN089_19360 [Duganella sp.]|nr:hypothetical protein [Duganella sp.]